MIGPLLTGRNRFCRLWNFVRNFLWKKTVAKRETTLVSLRFGRKKVILELYKKSWLAINTIPQKISLGFFLSGLRKNIKALQILLPISKHFFRWNFKNVSKIGYEDANWFSFIPSKLNVLEDGLTRAVLIPSTAIATLVTRGDPSWLSKNDPKGILAFLWL